MNELERKRQVEFIEKKMEKCGGLLDALDSNDKILLLDFSGSMCYTFEGKEIYQHLIDAVCKYEGEYEMIAFESYCKKITDLRSEKPRGGTMLTPALRMAREMGAKEYVVISDGIATDADKAIHYAQQNNMKVSTIFMGDDEYGRQFMERLANGTGGNCGGSVKMLSGFGGILEKKIAGLIEG